MNSKEERFSILEQVAQGRLSVTEAAARLGDGPVTVARDDIGGGKNPSITPEAPGGARAAAGNGKANWLRIQVDDLNTGKRRVSVNIPLKLMRFGLNLGRRFSPELEDLDLEELAQAASGIERGLLVDVQDETDGEHVRIFVE